MKKNNIEYPRDRLPTESGLDSVITWCKDAGITRVFIETFRGYTAERDVLTNAKKRFEEAGIEASGWCLLYHAMAD